jgi:hypothetical protein
VRLLLVLASVWLVTNGGVAFAKPLTMKSAERAIDLGLDAELAGDFAGAEKSLQEVIATATSSAEIAPRKRVESFVRSLSVRKQAFASHGKGAKAWAIAYESMLPFGLERSDRLWLKAIADVPKVKNAPMPKVALRFDLLKGTDAKTVKEQLERAMTKYGISIVEEKSARFVVRVHLDASEITKDSRGVRVYAEATAVVSDRMQPKRAAGSVSKQRSERRNQETEARRFALYRVLDDVGRRVVFSVRARVLEDASPPT